MCPIDVSKVRGDSRSTSSAAPSRHDGVGAAPSRRRPAANSATSDATDRFEPRARTTVARTTSAGRTAGRLAFVDHAALARLGATASEVVPGAILLKFKDSTTMATTFLRFQEHYESPEFAGKIFSLAEYKRWYCKENGGFTYCDDWGGFNIPSRVLTPFKAGKFAPLSHREQLFMQALAQVPGRFYVIGACDAGVAAHEVSHALFFTDPKYHERVIRVLRTIDLRPLVKALRDEGYAKNTVLDEIHAYLREGGSEFKAHGVDLAPYRAAMVELKKIYAETRAALRARPSRPA